MTQKPSLSISGPDQGDGVNKKLLYFIFFILWSTLAFAADKTFDAGETLALTEHTTWDNLYSDATSGDWATVTGAYNITVTGDTDISYVSFQNTGSIVFEDSSAIRRCVFEGQSSVTLGTSSSALSENIILENSDFRGQTGTIVFTVTGSDGAATGDFWITNNTFYYTSEKTIYLTRRDGCLFKGNVLYNTQLGDWSGASLVSGGHDYRENFSAFDDAASDSQTRTVIIAGNQPAVTFDKNYLFYDWDNPHPISFSGTGTGGIDYFRYNVFQVVWNTDGANIVSANSARDINISYNLNIGSGSLINLVNGGSTTVTGKNNTSYGTKEGNGNDGLLFLSESGPHSYTVNLSNNIVSGSVDIGDAINSITGTQTIASSGYNWFYNTTNDYDDITVTSGPTNDTTGTDPNFVDATRNLTDWYEERYSDASPTKAKAVAKLIVKNGYNSGTKKQSDAEITYDQLDLIEYVRAGFVPEAAGINQGGQNYEDIGALDDEGWNQWADHSIVKNRRDGEDDTSGSASVSISMARNELESFQVFVYADGAALENVDVSVGTISKGANTIDHVYIYKEHYVNCDTKSRVEYEAGYWPDALLPKVDRYYNEVRTGVFPVDVTASDVQGFWIDLGTTSSTDPGTYTGIVTITADGKKDEEITIAVEVYDFALDATSNFPGNYIVRATALSYGHGYEQNFNTATSIEIIQQYMKLYLYARLTPVIRGDGTSMAFTWDSGPKTLTITDYTPWLEYISDAMDGTAITSGPLSGATFAVQHMHNYGNVDWTGSIAAEDKETATRQYFQQVYDKFETEGWDPFNRLYGSVYDEPPCGASTTFRGETKNYCQIVKIQADDYNAINTGGQGEFKNVYVHSSIKEGLSDFEDDGFYAPNQATLACRNWDRDCVPNDPTGGERSDYQSGGAPYWTYLGCSSHGCREMGDSTTSNQIDSSADAVAMYNRAASFWRYYTAASGSFYWAISDLNYENDTYDDIFSEEFEGNGEGHLVYPGIVDKADRTWVDGSYSGNGDSTPELGGINDIPIASMRWKYLRDQQEDLEYFKLAEESTDRATVLATIKSVFNDETDIRFAYWDLNMSPTVLLTARAGVANLIDSGATISGMTIGKK